MNKVKRHFTEEALKFDKIIRRSIPFYPQMVEAIVDFMHFTGKPSPEILDLGAGTGEVAKQILLKFPNARITILDFVPEMLEIARHKLLPLTKNKGQLRCIGADFGRWQFDQSYDAVVANLTLHHLRTDRDKRQNYRQIFKNLKPGGIFCVGDIILGTEDKLTKIYIEKWLEFQIANQWSKREIAERMQRYKTEDCPAPLVKHLKWLMEAGFTGIDCVWKYYNFAVFGGKKK